MVRPRPVLDQINIVVADMEATVAFYRRLGLEIAEVDAEWRAWAPHHRSASTADGTRIDFDSVSFARQWDEGWPADDGRGRETGAMERERTRPPRRGGAGVVIGFRLESREAVDAVYAEMTGAGYRGQQSPYDAFWGARYAIIEDPDGNPVGLMSEVNPERRSAPVLPA